MIQGNNRGKIKQPPAKEVIKYIINPSISDAEAERSFQNYVECNKAHVLMLEKQGIIKKEVAKKILEVAEEMTAMGSKPSFALRPELEEMYFNLENYLISKIGLEVGGQQHTAAPAMIYTLPLLGWMFVSSIWKYVNFTTKCARRFSRWRGIIQTPLWPVILTFSRPNPSPLLSIAQLFFMEWTVTISESKMLGNS